MLSGKMKNKLLKHIFKKIKDNNKRFLSLFCMAFLGVGFFTGIQSCGPDMLKTLDNYVGHFKNSRIFDGNVALAAHNNSKFWKNLNQLSKIILG